MLTIVQKRGEKRPDEVFLFG